MNVRAVAAQVVFEVLQKHRSLSDVMPKYKAKFSKEEDGASKKIRL